ncbi:MAG: type II secretion system F family protein, partial [Phycisphaerae bacterium]
VGVVSGLDLPQVVELANSVTGSPALTADGVQMNQAMSRGLPLNQASPGRMLPTSVAATIQSGIAGNNLPETLTVLSEGYTREAQTRMSIAPAVVTPVSLLVIGVVVFLIIYAMALPFVQLLQGVGSPG